MRYSINEASIGPDATYHDPAITSARPTPVRSSARIVQNKNLAIMKDFDEDENDDDVMITGSRRISPRGASRIASPFSLLPATTPDFDENYVVDSLDTPTKSRKGRKNINSVSMEQVNIIEQTPPVAKCCFDTLPTELFQKIAGYLDTDKEVIDLSTVNKKCYVSITSSVWSSRLNVHFDKVFGKVPGKSATAYKARMSVVYQTPLFDDANLLYKYSLGGQQHSYHTIQSRRHAALMLLHKLIIESDAVKKIDGNGKVVVMAKNLEFIYNWMFERSNGKNLDLLNAALGNHSGDAQFWHRDRIVSTKSDGSLVLVIQLCLTHFALDPKVVHSNRGTITSPPHFDSAQSQAYASDSKQPLFVGSCKEILNVRWALSVVQFFKFHLLAPYSEGLFYDMYHYLPADQKPQPWFGKIKGGTHPVGSHWKGVFTFVDSKQLVNFREDEERKPSIDYADDDVQDLSLFFDEQAFSSSAWPHKLEILVATDPYPDASGTPGNAPHGELPEKFPLKAFFGSTRDDRPSQFYGRIHGLPPQQGIPGFQRISFIKFCTEGDEGVRTDDIWEYEGVVLPGGRIIVGRWRWVPINSPPPEPEEQYSGPFLFWNVDKSTAHPPIEPDEALNFRDILELHGIL